MKNQYFGDVRDLFKYDLIQHIIYNSKSLNNVLLTAMLTTDDATNEGNKFSYNKAKAGYKNSDLIGFLNSSFLKKREIKNIINYFEETEIDFELITDFITNTNRKTYFQQLVNKIKNNSLNFFDPDNGLEVNNYNEKHILFDEIEIVLDKMDDASTIMIYQHFPRVKRMDYIKKRQNEIETKLSLPCCFISDNEVVFFFITKTQEQQSEIANILLTYKVKYPKLFCDSQPINIKDKQLLLSY